MTLDCAAVSVYLYITTSALAMQKNRFNLHVERYFYNSNMLYMKIISKLLHDIKFSAAVTIRNSPLSDKKLLCHLHCLYCHAL